jgi:hypothetical protein
MANSILGSDILGQNLGPCNVYFGTETGGPNIYMGKTDATTIRKTTEKTDLVTSQDGAGRADAVITTETWEVEFGLAQATLDRQAEIDESIDLNLSGSDIIGAHFASVIGNGDLENAHQMKIVRIKNGVDSTNPLDTLTLWKARITSSWELSYDASTQRFMGTMAYCYKDENEVDSLGRPTFGKVGTV